MLSRILSYEVGIFKMHSNNCQACSMLLLTTVPKVGSSPPELMPPSLKGVLGAQRL